MRACLPAGIDVCILAWAAKTTADRLLASIPCLFWLLSLSCSPSHFPDLYVAGVFGTFSDKFDFQVHRKTVSFVEGFVLNAHAASFVGCQNYSKPAGRLKGLLSKLEVALMFSRRIVITKLLLRKNTRLLLYRLSKPGVRSPNLPHCRRLFPVERCLRTELISCRKLSR